MSWAPFPRVSHTVTTTEIDAYAARLGAIATRCTWTRSSRPPGRSARSWPTADRAADGLRGAHALVGAEQLPPGGMADVAFRGPVRAGDTITCTAAPPEATRAGDVLVRAVCRNQDGGLVLEALVVVPRQLAPRVH